MNLDQLNELELDDIGNWPKAVQIGVVVIIIALIGFFGYNYVLSDSLTALENTKEQESSLRKEFSNKARMAGQLPVLKLQMEEMELMFVQLLAQLPSDHEVAGLLDELSFVGADNGLEFKSISWAAEVSHEFSVELPIKIQVSGTYHELGKFASDVAALPRIIILKNFNLVKGSADLLNMSLLATTYRYKEKGAQR